MITIRMDQNRNRLVRDFDLLHSVHYFYMNELTFDEWLCLIEWLDKICFADLEDDVWRTLSDPTDGPVLYLHWCHLQRVLQQRPQCVRLRVACWTHVRKEHLEVRTFKISKPPFGFSFKVLTKEFLIGSIFFACTPCSSSVLAGTSFLAIDPAEPGAFKGPYPFGIDPVWTSHSSDLVLRLHLIVFFGLARQPH